MPKISFIIVLVVYILFLPIFIYDMVSEKHLNLAFILSTIVIAIVYIRYRNIKKKA